eukprot:TRINITY_DN5702_c0_g1_i1.p1 TRINITY_DN5702_c0_g1~~TRINITY_DN5702_c0_g1_i1.p1  ORF type:complete len:182 (+),score=42.85 TRINITY_DN5702_c0_g1_i1:77-622(+)
MSSRQRPASPKPSTAKKQTQKGSGDLLNVIATLEAYRVVYEAEIAELDRDLKLCDELSSKYGDFWKGTINHLRQTKTLKQNQCKDIQFQLDLFKLHLQQGKDLCRRLCATGQEIRVTHSEGSCPDQFEIEVQSQILSKAPLPPPAYDPTSTTVLASVTQSQHHGLSRISNQQALVTGGFDM